MCLENRLHFAILGTNLFFCIFLIRTREPKMRIFLWVSYIFKVRYFCQFVVALPICNGPTVPFTIFKCQNQKIGTFCVVQERFLKLQRCERVRRGNRKRLLNTRSFPRSKIEIIVFDLFHFLNLEGNVK